MTAKTLATSVTTKENGRLFKIRKQNYCRKTGVDTHTPVTPVRQVGSGVQGHPLALVYTKFEASLGYMRF